MGRAGVTSPTDLWLPASAGLLSPAVVSFSPLLALGPALPFPPATRASLSSLTSGGFGVMRFPEDSTTQLPAARRRGRAGGRAGRSGRPGPLPGLGQAGAWGWIGGVLGKRAPCQPALRLVISDPQRRPDSPRGRQWTPGGALCSATVPTPPARLSWGPQRDPRGGGGREFTLYLGPEGARPGSVLF